MRYLGGVIVLVWFGVLWYILGDHDALALCYLGGVAIYLEDLLLVMTLLSLEEFCYMLETLIMMP